MNYPVSFKYDHRDFIGIYENAFTEDECKKCIELFDKFDKHGYSHRRRHDGVLMEDSSVDISPIELEWDENFIDSFHDRYYSLIYPLYNNKYSSIQQLRKHKSKYIKIQKTLPTEGYHIWHCEDDGSYGNGRVLAWILYLNDVEEGGETEFLYQSLRIKPKVGTFILFPAYFTHTHRGNPPLSGVKYIATGWIEVIVTPEKQGKSTLPTLREPKNKFSYK
jgi:hypothetical protein